MAQKSPFSNIPTYNMDRLFLNLFVKVLNLILQQAKCLYNVQFQMRWTTANWFNCELYMGEKCIEPTQAKQFRDINIFESRTIRLRFFFLFRFRLAIVCMHACMHPFVRGLALQPHASHPPIHLQLPSVCLLTHAAAAGAAAPAAAPHLCLAAHF